MLDEFGLKLEHLLIGIAGGIVALSDSSKTTFLKAIAIILTGGITSGYFTPTIIKYFTVIGPLEYTIAFIVGLLGMRIVRALLFLGDAIAKDPIGLWKRLRRKN